MKEFEKNCQIIVQNISTKFIDLGLDDGPQSELGENMFIKQEKFRKEFEKNNFPL